MRFWNFQRALRTALTPPLRDRVLASWSPWVLGFSPEGGSRLYSEGELVMSSRKNGKRTPGTPDGTCGQPERGQFAWPLVVFWHPVLGRAAFPQAHTVPGGLAVPRTGRLLHRGEYQSNIRYVQLWESHPSMGRKEERKNKKRERAGQKFKNSAGQNHLFHSLALE